MNTPNDSQKPATGVGSSDLLADLPDTVTSFARELAALCAKHQLIEFTGTYSLGWKSNTWGQMQFAWQAGRHGDESQLIRLHLEKRVTLDVEANAELSDRRDNPKA